MAANRLQRWAIILAVYTYDIQYKPTAKHGNADTLSRLQMNKTIVIHTVQLERLPLKATDNSKATDKDSKSTTSYRVDGQRVSQI